MTVLAEQVNRYTLDRVLHVRGPVAAVYAGPGPEVANEYRLEWSTRWHPIRNALEDQGADERTRAALEREVRTMTESRAARGHGHVAVFAAEGTVLAAFPAPGATWEDQATSAAPAHVLPLLAWAQELPPYVLAVVDRSGADIEASIGAGHAPVRSVVTGPDDELGWNDAGGLTTQGKAERRAVDSWRHNAAAVAGQAAAAMERVGATVLVVSGDLRVMRLVREHLPGWVQRTAVVEQVRGSREADGSQRHRTEVVAAVVRDAVRQGLEEQWRTFVEERAPGGRAAEGEHATLTALAESRVATLFVDPARTRGHRAWFGPGGTQVQSVDRPRPSWPGARQGDLVDVAVRSALLTGAEVRVLPSDQAPVHGIGALCRFR